MTELIIQDWLADCATLSPVEVHSFASTLKHNDEVITALYAVLEERTKYPNLVDPVCNQLFSFYRSREAELQKFTLQFLPILIYIYLNSVAHGDKRSCRSVETLLIGVYNLEVVDEKGQPVVISFRLPSLAQASIYHEPMNLAHASLTQTALRRLEECNTKLVSWGPLPQVETLNAQNRLKVMTALLFIFNKHIGSLHKISLKILCKVSSKLVGQGFSKHSHQRSSYTSDNAFLPKLLPRIPVSSQFLLELASGLYYAMYNDYGYVALQAIDEIYNRSCFECYADVILVANAIKNSSHVTSAGQPSEGPMGISVALSPATTTVTTVNKSMITNASFRTKKLPDDIPIVPKDEAGGGDSKALMSISEEKEEEAVGFATRGSSLRGKDAVTKNLQKLGIGKKSKDKEGRSASKTNLNPKDVMEKRQSLQLTNFKEKVSLKSPHVQNGDAADADGHSPMSGTRKKTLIENGPIAEVANGSVSESVGFKSPGGYMTEISSDAVDSVPLDEDVLCLDASPSNNKKLEDKPFMQVSSV